MVCVGEGENALVDICKKIENGQDYSSVTNLWVKQKDKTIKKNILDECQELFYRENFEQLLDNNTNLIGFENEKFCKRDKKKCKFVPIDGRFVRRQIDLGNFDQLKNYVSSNIANYIKKNM